MKDRILVWDFPTRVFHWAVVANVLFAFLTGDSERWRDLHVTAGYTLIGLLIFRVTWGLVGSRYARFRAFPFRPAAVPAYLAGLLVRRDAPYVGHNPAGSVMIYLLLAGIAAACASGLVAYTLDSEVLGEGHEFVANGLLVLAGFHVIGAVLSSLLHRENLVKSMVTGYKYGRSADAIRRSYPVLGVALFAAIIAFWYESTIATDSLAAHEVRADVQFRPPEHARCVADENNDANTGCRR